jgi:hypothetical protein
MRVMTISREAGFPRTVTVRQILDLSHPRTAESEARRGRHRAHGSNVQTSVAERRRGDATRSIGPAANPILVRIPLDNAVKPGPRSRRLSDGTE